MIFFFSYLENISFVYFIKSFCLGFISAGFLSILFFIFCHFHINYLPDKYDLSLKFWTGYKKDKYKSFKQIDKNFYFYLDKKRYLDSSIKNNIKLYNYIFYIKDIDYKSIKFFQNFTFFFGKTGVLERTIEDQLIFDGLLKKKSLEKKVKSLYDLNSLIKNPYDFNELEQFKKKLDEMFFYTLLDEINSFYNPKKSIIFARKKLIIEMKIMNNFHLTEDEHNFYSGMVQYTKCFLKNPKINIFYDNMFINSLILKGFHKDYLLNEKYIILQYIKILYYTKQI